MSHRIIPRSEWGARHKGGFHDRPVGSLRRYLHHSVTIAPDLVPPFTDDYAAVRTLEGIGQSRFGGGISYTFAITPAGLIFEGHGIGRTGAHTAGYNTIAAGICLIGNYEKDDPTPQQLAALDWLLHEGVRRRWWTSPTLTGGHRDTKSTACPGRNAYQLIGAVNAGKYHDTTEEEPDMDKNDKAVAAETLSLLKQIRGERVVDGPAGEPKEQDRLTVTAALRRLMIEQRSFATKAEARDSAQTAIIRTLAESKGVDPDALLKLLGDKVDESLAKIDDALAEAVLPLEGEITLTRKEN